MNGVDIIILIILALFIWKGIKMGLIESIGGILGIFIGLFMAGKYAEAVADMIQNVLFHSETLAKIIGFLLVFILVNRAVALIFWVIDKVFHIIAIIPFLKSLNSLLGGILGLVEGIIIIGVIAMFLSFIPFISNFQSKVDNSKFAGLMATVEKIVTPFMPESLTSWASDIPFSQSIPRMTDEDQDIEE